MSTWRFAGRLAWREVRRRPGRTALVALLVAVPVLAMTVASVLARSFAAEDPFTLDHGTGVDMVLSDVDAETVLDVLPAGAEAWTIGNVGAPIQDVRGTATEWVDIVELRDGRPKARVLRPEGDLPGPGEVWLTRNLLDELDVDLGEELALAYPPGTWRVVGTGDLPANLRSMVLAELDDDAFIDDVQALTLVDLPGDPPVAEVAATFRTVSAQLAVGGTHRAEGGDEAQRNAAVLWTWVAGTFGLGILGIVIAAAFATSARRQLVTIGLLASNGAPERAIGRALTLQGTWSGLVGSIVGVGGGVVALRAAQPWLDDLRNGLDASWSVRASDLVVICAIGTLASTFAARLPARTAARVPVMAALAGRRPLGAVPAQLVPFGLVAFGVGVALLAAATASGGSGSGGSGTGGQATTAVVGAVVLLAGICCCTPLVTDVASGLGSRVGRSWRLAGRSLGRTRARTAAVVTAIAVTAAASLAGAVGMTHVAAPPGVDRSAPADLLEVMPAAALPPGVSEIWSVPQVESRVDASMRAEVEAISPGATWIPRRVVAIDLPTEISGSGLEVWAYEDLLVATPEVLDVYRVSGENRDLLREAGVLSVWGVAEPGPRDVESGGRRVAIDAVPAVARDDRPLLGQNGWMSGGSFQGRTASHLISPEAVAELGLDTIDAGAIAWFPEPLDGRQHRRIVDAVLGADAAMAMWYTDARPSVAGWMVSSAPYVPDLPPVATIQAVIVGAVLLLTLGVVAVGLALAATESRDERDVLVAVGARPRTLRTMAGAKAVVMTLAGVAVAVPGGLIPAYAVSRAAGIQFRVPWLVLVGLVLVVPSVAGVAASVVSGIAQRVRPVRMSTLAVD